MEDNKKDNERLIDPIELRFREVINKMSGENFSNTPDHILSAFLTDVFHAANKLVRDREDWYGVHCEPGNIVVDTKCEDKTAAMEKLKNAKQFVLITVNGSADMGNIDWDTKSLEEAYTLLQRGMTHIFEEHLKEDK